MSRRRWFLCTFVALAGVLLLGAAGVLVCEGAIRVPRIQPAATPFEGTANAQDARWRSVEVKARDGVVLRGWLLQPVKSNGGYVLALHGIADSRMGQVGLARLFVANGYSVLMPDSRGHGVSGGELVTYGLREADDVSRWLDWLVDIEHPRNLFGMGESLGGAVLLQSLAREHRFRAVVAECAFANFADIAVYRVAQRIPLPDALGHAAAAPVVWSAFLYARMRYGLDFRRVSPETAMSDASTPVLLIHGLRDTRTPPVHSRTLAAKNSGAVLWLVPGAEHTGAFGTVPEEFERRVLGWFSAHAVE